MRGKRLSIGLRAVLATLIVTLLATSTWAATNWNEKVLHNFGNGTDGYHPEAGLILDAAGNLYGTTYWGGNYGDGTVFELTPNGSGGWTETVLYNFCSQTGCADGANPAAGLIFDAAGNLYGTTYGGGTYNYYCSGGCGTVFKLTPQAGGGWTETVLHSFGNVLGDGFLPDAGLIFDVAGNLYGTTYAGGAYGQGAVFELTPTGGGGWTVNVLFSFNYTDGFGPSAALIFDAAGNLYGTTILGGNYGAGTVFELTPNPSGGWTETVLHSFNRNGTDGWYPEAGLILYAAGNLYGTTYWGGTQWCGGSGCGTVFELTVRYGGWAYTVLHSFSGGDGAGPSAGLILDAAGNLYGTTSAGGVNGVGTVLELTPIAGGGWTEQVLHNFGNGTDGVNPWSGLIFDAAGNLYGTTYWGGNYGDGTVFELTPIYPCAKCSHGVDREVHGFPAEKRDVLERRKPIE